MAVQSWVASGSAVQVGAVVASRNSSPPIRAITACGSAVADRVRAVWTRAWSPALWPWVSLSALKLSRSICRASGFLAGMFSQSLKENPRHG